MDNDVYKRWSRLLRKYGEQYSRTYQAEQSSVPHPSETGFTGDIEQYEDEER